MSEREVGVGGEKDAGDAALRALAEAANRPMTCGGHQSMGSLMRCEECTARSNARRDLSAACSPDVVLSLLDRATRTKAAAWDEGWTACADRICDPYEVPDDRWRENPYRPATQPPTQPERRGGE